MDKWISVSQEKPPNGQSVIIGYYNIPMEPYVCIAFLITANGDTWYEDDADQDEISPPSHWIPIPKLQDKNGD